MPLREVVIKRKRAGIVISTITVIAVAGAGTIIKGFGDPDTSDPVIRITAPAASQGIFGEYTLTATCKDNVGCTSVVFKIDGTPVGTDTEAPFEVDVDTSDFGNGALTVGAVAEDAAANTTTAISKDAEVVNGLGKVFVAADGDDEGVNCRRYSSFSAFPADHTTVCESFLEAHLLAGAGDVILVADGTYPLQRVCGGPISFGGCTGTLSGDPDPSTLVRTGSAPVTFLGVTEHGATVHQLLRLGQDNGGIAPQHIAFDGIDVEGQILLYNPPSAGGYTYRNMHVYNIANQAITSNPLISVTGGNNMTIDHVELGPACCDGDAMDAAAPANFLLEDSQIHDIYDSCRWIPSSITDDLGACSSIAFGDVGFSAGTLTAGIDDSQTTITVSGPGTIDTGWTHAFVVLVGSEQMNVTAGQGTTTWTVTRGYNSTTPASHLNAAALTYVDAGYDHVDGIQAWGGTNFQMVRNQWWAIGANGDPVGQTIFLVNDPIGNTGLYFDGVLIENNSIIEGDTNNNAVSIERSSGANVATPYTENLQILYNTVWNTRSDFSGGNITVGGLASGTTYVLAGNIARVLKGFSACAAPGTGGVYPIFSKNIGAKAGGCGDTDIMNTPDFVSADPLDPNLALVQNGQPAIGGGENTYCPATDVLGNPRPTLTPCDVGAYQH